MKGKGSFESQQPAPQRAEPAAARNQRRNRGSWSPGALLSSQQNAAFPSLCLLLFFKNLYNYPFV